MKKFIAASIAIAGLLLARPAFAQSDTTLIIPGSGTGSWAVAGSTNNYNLSGVTVNTNYITLSSGNRVSTFRSSDLWLSFSGTYANTSTNNVTITVRMSGAVDGANYTNNATTLVLTALAGSTNTFVIIQKLDDAMPVYGVAAIEVPATTGGGARLTNSFLKGLVKLDI